MNRFVMHSSFALFSVICLTQSSALAGPPQKAAKIAPASAEPSPAEIARAKKDIAEWTRKSLKMTQEEGERAAILRFFTDDFVSVTPSPVKTEKGFGTVDKVTTREAYLKDAKPKGKEKLPHEGDNDFVRDLPVAEKNKSWRPDKYVFKGSEIQVTHSEVTKSERRGFGRTNEEREKFRTVKDMYTMRSTYVRTAEGLLLKKMEFLGGKTLVDGKPVTDFNDPIEDTIIKTEPKTDTKNEPPKAD